MSELKDSGERRDFDSGAVRDMATGKGRCDLLPLGQVALLYALAGKKSEALVIEAVERFLQNQDSRSLLKAALLFMEREGGRLGLEDAILAVAVHYEDGALKYDERNWQQGMPVKVFIDSGLRHLFMHLRGDRDEPHDRAFLWNMLSAAWTHDKMPAMRMGEDEARLIRGGSDIHE